MTRTRSRGVAWSHSTPTARDHLCWLSVTAFAAASGASTNLLVDHGGHCYFPEAVRENEEVVPVNVSTWVLPSGVTVGR